MIVSRNFANWQTALSGPEAFDQLAFQILRNMDLMMKAALNSLIILLITSNGYWLYASLDNGVTVGYQSAELYEYENTQEQLIKIFKEVASGKSKSEVVRIAEKYSEVPAFEKNGCTWIGWLGFKFDEQGIFQDIDWATSHGVESPCSISNNHATHSEEQSLKYQE